MYTSEIKIRVRYGETDQMGYLYHGFYALYYEEGRTEAIRALGVSYNELEKSGIAMPVVELNSKFVRPALYDDLVTVKTTLRTLPEKSKITFHTELFNEQGKLLNRGIVTLVFFDSNKKETTNIPQTLLDKLKPFFE